MLFRKNRVLKDRDAPYHINTCIVKFLHELFHVRRDAPRRNKYAKCFILRYEREVTAVILDVNDEGVEFGFFYKLQKFRSKCWGAGTARSHINRLERLRCCKMRDGRLKYVPRRRGQNRGGGKRR